MYDIINNTLCCQCACYPWNMVDTFLLMDLNCRCSYSGGEHMECQIRYVYRYLVHFNNTGLYSVLRTTLLSYNYRVSANVTEPSLRYYIRCTPYHSTEYSVLRSRGALEEAQALIYTSIQYRYSKG